MTNTDNTTEAKRAKLANALRFLSIDAIHEANSGHPGMPMGMANIAEVLWNDFLKHNPKNPTWPNRDRFVLSNGHGSMLLYALLHLTGYDVTINDIKDFRKLHSKTPGHPEYGVTPGVEVTTGPLGQGFANAVGLALAERILAAQFNRDPYNIVDHYTYCFVGDGCLMEGISYEAAALAGSLGLNKLIVFWDDNGVSLDGPVANCSNEDLPKRFAACNWQVIANIDGHNPEQIKKAISFAHQSNNKPVLICCKTTIGFGSPNCAGLAKCHGTPLGAIETALVRQALNWPYPAFDIPISIYAAWDAIDRGKQLEADWQLTFNAYAESYPYLAAEYQRQLKQQLPSNIYTDLQNYITDLQKPCQNNAIATRIASRNTLDLIAETLPELIGGAADLTSPSCTLHKNAKIIQAGNFAGNYIHYGAREFAMAAVMNGLALHGGLIPYGGTFLAFSDYARSAIRMSALMQQQVIYVLSHDSIALGEDGPTHQPIEQLAALRLMPNLSLWRPYNAIETAVAWHMALTRTTGPTVLALSRQPITTPNNITAPYSAITQGGYILQDCQGSPAIILIATGAEVALAIATANAASATGIMLRVVSMPSVDVFLKQSLAYQTAVLPKIIPKIVLEAGVSGYWQQFVQGNGAIIGIDSYGCSGNGTAVYEDYGFSVTNVLLKIEEILSTKEHLI